MRKLAFAMACTAFLAACDGGSSSPAPTPTPTPPPAGGNAPSFTSAGTISIAENTTGTVYTAVATDPEGSAVTYSLTGGPDQALFNLDAAGRLSFKTAPDYEAPTDSNANNLYQIEITASDGNRTTVLPLNVFVTDINANGYRMAVMGRVYADMTQYVRGAVREDAGLLTCFDVSAANAGGRLCAGNWSGSIDTSDFSTNEERGLLGWTFTRNTPPTLPFHVGDSAIALYTAANGDILVTWSLDQFAGTHNWRPIPGLAPIWRIPNAASRNLAGWIGVGPDGYLYIALGDATDPAKAQDPDSPFGKILRLDTTRDDFPADPNRNFGVPAGGIVAGLGVRKPWRGAFDTAGNLIFVDNGDTAREEVNVLKVGETGVNYGWPWFEGSLRRQAGGPASLRAPAIELEWGNGPLNANGLAGGYVPDPTAPTTAQALIGQYIFGDVSGRIWMVPLTRLLTENLTGADLTRTEETLYAAGKPITNIRSMSSNMVIDNTGFYWLIVK